MQVVFGMGINKPDGECIFCLDCYEHWCTSVLAKLYGTVAVRFVIHHSLSKSLETYYQVIDGFLSISAYFQRMVLLIYSHNDIRRVDELVEMVFHHIACFFSSLQIFLVMHEDLGLVLLNWIFAQLIIKDINTKLQIFMVLLIAEQHGFSWACGFAKPLQHGSFLSGIKTNKLMKPSETGL